MIPMIPSQKLNTPSIQVINTNNADAKNIGKSTLRISYLVSIFLATIATTARINKMLAMLEPITLPITISDEFFDTAKIDEINSGREVPIATIVTPTINAGIPSRRPIFSAALVKYPEDFSRTNRLNTNIAAHMIIVTSIR